MSFDVHCLLTCLHRSSYIVALKKVYPPCKLSSPHLACSNQDEIWGRASSLGQEHKDGRVAEQLLAGGHIRPSTSAASFENRLSPACRQAQRIAHVVTKEQRIRRIPDSAKFVPA